MRVNSDTPGSLIACPSKSGGWKTILSYQNRIHGTGIFTYIWLIFMVNEGKYTSPMDPVGIGVG